MEFYEGFQEKITVMKNKIKSSGADFIRFTVADIHGISIGKVIPSPCVAEYLDGGLNLYAAGIVHGPKGQPYYTPEKVKKEGHNDALYVAEPSTFRILPWASNKDVKVGQVLCEQHWIDTHKYGVAPRTIARNQLKSLKSLGLSLLSAIEHEFILLDIDTLKPAMVEDHAVSQFSFLDKQDLLVKIYKQLEQVDVGINVMQKEYAPSQFEIALRPSHGIKAADNSFLFRDAVKSIARQDNMLATFMSKPLYDPNSLGNGGHFNHSLWSLDGHGVLYDPEDDLGLSEVGRWWVGGLLKHGPALTALCCPTVNCYRRLHRPLIPSLSNWGIENRLAMVRAKVGNKKTTLFENRLPGGVANPYLVLAVTVAAGIDGITNKIEPPKEGNVKEGIPLPRNLEEALVALENDQVIVKALGEQFVEWFCGAKREFETVLDTDPTRNLPAFLDIERDQYLNFA